MYVNSAERTAQPKQRVPVVRMRDLVPVQATPEATACGREQRERAAKAQRADDAVTQ